MIEEYDGSQSLDSFDVVRFTAEWCVPCKAYAPIFDRHVHNRDLKAVIVDVDEFPYIAQDFGVRSIPSVFANGDGGWRRVAVDFSDL